MKNYISMTLCFILFASTSGIGQQKIKEKDLLGQWKLKIEINEALDEAKEDLDDEDAILGKLVLSTISGFVGEIIENIDIYLNFQSGGKVEVTVNAFGEEEVEYTTWYIDKSGKLFIEDTEHLQSDKYDYWTLENGILVPSDSEDEKYVYMVRVDN